MSKSLVEVLELASEQEGLLTTQQAQRRGITRLTLSRLANQHVIERLSHGVYATAEGAVGPHADIRSAWLSLDPHRFAFERLDADPTDFTVTHRSAAELWGIGQLIPDKLEFVSTSRKRTRREDVRLRRRSLTAADITLVAGLPCTTIERTIADLIGTNEDLSTVSDALGDAELDAIDIGRLRTLLDPLARRSGHRSGTELLQALIAGSSRLERSLVASLLAGRLSSLMDAMRPGLVDFAMGEPSAVEEALRRAEHDQATHTEGASGPRKAASDG